MIEPAYFLQILATGGTVLVGLAAGVAGWITAGRQIAQQRLLRSLIEQNKNNRTEQGSTIATLSDNAGMTDSVVIEIERGQTHRPQAQLIDEYHRQGLNQANVSFWFSIAFAVLGFFLIVAAGVQGMQKSSNPGYLSAALPLISGTVVEAVAALFFVQSNHARKLMIDFFDKLRTDRRFEEALSFASQVESEPTASNLRAYLSLRFADINPPPGAFESILGTQPIKTDRL